VVNFSTGIAQKPLIIFPGLLQTHEPASGIALLRTNGKEASAVLSGERRKKKRGGFVSYGKRLVGSRLESRSAALGGSLGAATTTSTTKVALHA